MAIAWKVVGHRGYAACYPENTMAGFDAALALNVDAIEFDVQLSCDGIPVVLHDNDLSRTTDGQGSLAVLPFSKLQGVSCHYPQKFAEKFYPLPLLSLEQVCSALQTTKARVFIEIKKESIGILKREDYVNSVLLASAVLGNRRAIISFDAEVLRITKKRTQLVTGWCIEHFSQASLREAQALKPNILICSCDLPGDAALWPGPWEWFVYGVETLEQARYWSERGAKWIEADDPAAVQEEGA